MLIDKANTVKNICILIILLINNISSAAADSKKYVFNTDVLDLDDKKNIDLNKFSEENYIMPGEYNLRLKINGESYDDIGVRYLVVADDVNSSRPCLTPDVVSKLGLTNEYNKKITWWHDGQCLNPESLPGMSIQGDLSTSSLNVSIPQAYIEYTSPNWDPPSRWDNGIPALFTDYNINASENHSYSSGNNTKSLATNGVIGANLSAWRLRTEWQSRNDSISGSHSSNSNSFDFNRFYAYRAIASLKAKLTLGEDYLSSNIFDGFRFTGVGLKTDLSMIPPNLRGYAPEVTGVAKTNAKVTVSQQGRILYQSQVAPGPFRIQDLSEAVNGTLDVSVEEQDGSVQRFQLDTSSLPYLTRPGQVQYKLAIGQPTDYDHHREGDNFLTGEFSWGVNNGWSLIGGTLNSEKYNAFSVGIGRDLLAFGTVSLDATHSFAKINGYGELDGGSYRLSYSKRFEDLDSQIQFAGYRFSDQDYMSMSDFLSSRKSGKIYGKNKELYTVSVSKNFNDYGISTYLNYNHQTYWDRPENNYYSLMLSKYFDIGHLKSVSMSLSANRSVYNGINDDSLYLSLNIPLSNGGSVGYSMNAGRKDFNNSISYYDKMNDRTNYQLNTGFNRKGGTASSYVSYQGDSARLTGNASFSGNQYRAFGLTASGSLTATPKGAAASRISDMGGARLLVDTSGISDVSLVGNGFPVNTNYFGKAVIPNISSYYRSSVKINLNKLADDVDAQQSVVQATLTEGAVGYRTFSVISGKKAMTTIVLPNGDFPPLGAQVLNDRKQSVGIVGDLGATYISGIHSSEKMMVLWGRNDSCRITFPKNVDKITDTFSLPCS